MKHTYIQPVMYIVRVESCDLVCASSDEPQKVDVTAGGTTTEFDAPRLRLWDEEK